MREAWWKVRILGIHLKLAFEAWRGETKFDERCCCSGSECGCGGETWREFWAYRFSHKST